MKVLFTSESVGPGHPDKLCDQISDAILDECLRKDPYCHCAIECYATTQYLVIGGEVRGNLEGVDYENIARNTIKEIGYDDASIGFDYKTCEIKVLVKEQSEDINQGVERDGAGDQGIMFGYACKETSAYMPLAIYLSHELVKRADYLRKTGKFYDCMPDMKSQVTIDYTDEKNPIIDTVLMSVQHREDTNLEEFKEFIKQNVIYYVLKENGFDYKVNILINPTGRFAIGGPNGDTGLTGRKIIVDTYGGYAHHGGGAFSGKDATKVDRSAAYMLRYIAKNLVAANICDKVELQAGYAIGVAEPVSLYINAFKTNKYPVEKIEEAIKRIFNLTPKGIIETLELRNPIFKQTATFGHFGRNDLNLPWEKLDKVQELKDFIK